MTDTLDSQDLVDEFPSLGQAGADPYAVPLQSIVPSDAELFETNTMWGYFERLRNEDPVHYCADSVFGPYWSVTKYDDIVAVEKDPELVDPERQNSIVAVLAERSHSRE